ncbi:MAG: hypothetical protein GF388_02740, partial [Candidatus Aegiribacteria sp.]|nr:hypothetical protein [Candidatus Aegiribacteria sp.]MBD3294213.1 hypothetical protein [Candidatus Fermentibacteria bacterium]
MDGQANLHRRDRFAVHGSGSGNPSVRRVLYGLNRIKSYWIRKTGGCLLLTFLFTDIQESTKKWQLFEDKMAEALKSHDRIIEDAVGRSGGNVVKHTGDGFMAVFQNGCALKCALAIQKDIGSADWTAVDGLKLRVGISSGEVSRHGEDYFGPTVNRAARLVSVAWGGQILLDSGAAEKERLPEGSALVDRGVHMLRDLLRPQQLYTLDHPDLENVHPPLSTVSARPHNLPVQPTPFVGRRRELDEMLQLLKDPKKRLITILGYGGLGKTRTALQAAADAIDLFRHGAWFVPLEEAGTASDLASGIAESLSYLFSGGGSELDELNKFLSDRELLLVLDNFEHLTELSPLISKILSAAGEVNILVTSRKRLGVREEFVYDLSEMSLPPTGEYDPKDYDSTSLFLAMARRVKPNFNPGREEMRVINSICKAVGGLPLAIELTASWMRSVSCRDLERELRRSTEILESGGDLPSRQRSMQAVFQYSWELLGSDEKACLPRLSVFEGGFDLRAAAEVAECGMRTLRNLCDSSLIRNDDTRYRMHPLVREYAAKKLKNRNSESEEIRRRHSSYYHGYVEDIQTRMSDGSQQKTLEDISGEFPNIRKGALEAADSMNEKLISDYMKGISHFLQIRSRFSEGVELFTEMDRMISMDTADSQREQLSRRGMSARLKERKATFLMMAGRRREAAEILGRAVDISHEMADSAFRAICLAGLGNIAYLQDDLENAEENWSDAADLLR